MNSKCLVKVAFHLEGSTTIYIMTGFYKVAVDFDPPQFKIMEQPRSMNTNVDSDHPHNNARQKQIHCVFTVKNGFSG